MLLSSNHEVLCDEASWYKAVLLRRDALQDRGVHAGGEDAREDFVVGVEECDRPVVARVVSLAFVFVQDRDGAIEEGRWERAFASAFFEDFV